MADKLTPKRRSANMAKIRCRDTKPEMIVRRLVHGMGYRYRLHGKNLPGKPDLVFGPRKKIIFVHGCFWHQHSCRDGRIPASRCDYWEPKLHRNVERDVSHRQKLEAAGWEIFIVWECETKSRTALMQRLDSFISDAP